MFFFSPVSGQNFPCSSLCLLPLTISPCTSETSLALLRSFSLGIYREQEDVPLNSSLNNIHSFPFFSHILWSSPLTTLTVFCSINLSMYLNTEHHTCSHKHRTEVKNHFPQPTAILANATQYVVGLHCHHHVQLALH